MNNGTDADLASVFSSRPNGSFSTMRKVRSSHRRHPPRVTLASSPPCTSLSVKRFIEGMTIGRGDRLAVMPIADRRAA